MRTLQPRQVDHGQAGARAQEGEGGAEAGGGGARYRGAQRRPRLQDAVIPNPNLNQPLTLTLTNP